jgi:hypothetical protein
MATPQIYGGQPVKERSTLSVGLRILSAAFVLVIYIAAIVISYRSAARLDANINGTPKWLYPAVVTGLVIVGSLGVCADTIDRKTTPYPWILIIIGAVVQIVFGLIETSGWTIESVVQIALPPITTALSMAEFSREVRNLLAQRSAS